MSKSKQLDRSIMPPIGKQLILALNEPAHIRLDNGIDLYIINEGEIDVTKLDIIINAGTSVAEKKMVAECTLKLLCEGTTTMTSADIAQKIEYYGAAIDTTISKDNACLTLYSVSEQLPNLIPLMKDMIVNPSFSKDELENYVNRKREQFLLNNDKVRFKAAKEFNSLVFGSNSSYGRTSELLDYDNLKRNDLVEFFNSYYQPQNTYIILSGKISNETISLINKHFGTIIETKHFVKTNTLNKTNKIVEKYKFVIKENALQSALRIGRPIVDKLHPDTNSLVVVNTILGGYFGSRLMSNLREDKGFTYGVRSFLVNYKHGSYFSIVTEVNAAHTESALREIRIELEKLCTELVPTSELNLVKNYIYGTYLRSFDGPIAQAERFRSAKDLDLNFSYYISRLNYMMEQTPDQLLKVANKYFKYDDMIKVVVGPTENKLENESLN